MIRSGKRVRNGFTLVEMLVVIVIIGILAALITAAAATALWSAKQTRIKVEVDQLAGAMEAFKQKYGSYPPANLCCPGDGNRFAANPQLLAFVARAFPRYTMVTTGLTPPISSLAEQIAYDLQNAGVDVSEFNPQVSLVFWLSGFGPDPTDPFNRNNLVVSRTPFFSFNQSQLMAWAPYASPTGTLYPAVPSTTGTLYLQTVSGPVAFAGNTPPSYGIGQMIYNAPYGNAAYCYFDYQSYGSLNIPPLSPPYIGQAAQNSISATSPGIVYANSSSSPLPQEYLNGHLVSAGLYNGTGYVMPYAYDVNGNNQFDTSDTFCKPTSFQIISAGQDGTFGTQINPGSVTPGPTNPVGRLYPTGLNYDMPPTLGGSADDDNVTNFCERSNLEAAKP